MNVNTVRRLGLAGAIVACACGAESARATHTIAYDPANDMIDTTDYSGLAAGYWFANFNNPAAVVGDAMNSHEAKNLPAWVLLDSDPANAMTTYSFTVGPPISTSTGGQPGWNSLTLPGGALSGVSGAAVDTPNGPGNTDNFLSFSFGAGVPSEVRLWVVVDNEGTPQVNANPNQRVRPRLRHADDSGDIRVEALPGGSQVGAVNNGIADAYAFVMTGVEAGDIFKIQLTSAANSHGSIAGFMVQPIPEPTTVVLSVLGLIGAAAMVRRRRKT